jgi:hypothetical protein
LKASSSTSTPLRRIAPPTNKNTNLRKPAGRDTDPSAENNVISIPLGMTYRRSEATPAHGFVLIAQIVSGQKSAGLDLA